MLKVWREPAASNARGSRLYIYLACRDFRDHASGPEPQTASRKLLMVYEDWSGSVDIAGHWFLKEFGIQDPIDCSRRVRTRQTPFRLSKSTHPTHPQQATKGSRGSSPTPQVHVSRFWGGVEELRNGTTSSGPRCTLNWSTVTNLGAPCEDHILIGTSPGSPEMKTSPLSGGSGTDGTEEEARLSWRIVSSGLWSRPILPPRHTTLIH